ncbi:hypothetical protein E3N88_40907 [Mikania micrantha]|uniref:Epidermal patterning factor-like protein n=1 Tax=Mikania micrantha TaxID=192012 RepID=A0A5N6LNW2_9ASTR|nr:hypothetical protein E3N88_40907 [Mikania micrantha]
MIAAPGVAATGSRLSVLQPVVHGGSIGRKRSEISASLSSPVRGGDAVDWVEATSSFFEQDSRPIMRIRFEALQSDAGKNLLRRSGRAPDDISSVVLVEQNRSYIKSEAVLKIMEYIDLPFPQLAFFLQFIVARKQKDVALMNWIAGTLSAARLSPHRLRKSGDYPILLRNHGFHPDAHDFLPFVHMRLAVVTGEEDLVLTVIVVVSSEQKGRWCRKAKNHQTSDLEAQREPLQQHNRFPVVNQPENISAERHPSDGFLALELGNAPAVAVVYGAAPLLVHDHHQQPMTMEDDAGIKDRANRERKRHLCKQTSSDLEQIHIHSSIKSKLVPSPTFIKYKADLPTLRLLQPGIQKQQNITRHGTMEGLYVEENVYVADLQQRPHYLNEGVSLVQQKNKILGSRPPGCVNKCMKCSPCRATLVIPPHHKMVDCRDQSFHGEDGCYYLLSWKCKCGDKLFQP